jgi:hypothetical protein
VHYLTGLIVAKLNNSGAHQWLTNIEANYPSNAGSITCDNSGNAYLGIGFSGTIYPGLLSFTASGTGDGLYSKVKVSGANAGPDKHLGACCTVTQIGTPAMANCSYLWSPGTDLSATNVAEPICSLTAGSRTYTLTCTTNAGCITTDQVTVDMNGIICCRMGDEELVQTDKISVSNPSTDKITLINNNNTNVILEVEIYDVMGKRISIYPLHSNNRETEINISEYKNGFYFLTVIFENGNKQTEKILIGK